MAMRVSSSLLVAGGPWARGEAAGWRDGEAVRGAESWAGWRRRVPWVPGGRKAISAGRGGRGPGPEGVGLRGSEQKVYEVPGDVARMTG